MPAAAHAPTSGRPYFGYGPTVVATTWVDAASAASAAASLAVGDDERPVRGGPPSSARVRSSFSPSGRQGDLASAGAVLGEVAAVSLPTKPVAP